MNNFEMLVTEDFTLADKTTVFVGQITSAGENIGPCECELVFDGDVVTSFPIDGEMILKNKTPGARAVSTLHPVSESALDYQSGKLVLRASRPKRTPSR